MVASTLNTSHTSEAPSNIAPILEGISSILGRFYTPEVEIALKKISAPVLQKFYEFMESERARKSTEFTKRISDVLAGITK